MQSGKAKTMDWVLEFEPKDARRQDALMGWTQTGDTESSQVRLSFDTREEAVRYADQHGIAFQLIEATVVRLVDYFRHACEFKKDIKAKCNFFIWETCGFDNAAVSGQVGPAEVISLDHAKLEMIGG